MYFTRIMTRSRRENISDPISVGGAFGETLAQKSTRLVYTVAAGANKFVYQSSSFKKAREWYDEESKSRCHQS